MTTLKSQKILYLTKYTRMAGSSRMRSYQYFPYLEKEGFEITVKPFFDDQYLEDLYNGKKNIRSVVKSYWRRFFVLFSIGQFDRVVIEKEIFPFLPAFAEFILKTLGVKYIVDYDDAIFHNYDQHPNQLIRKFLGNKIANVMKYSSVVVAGNSYLAAYAKKSGAKKIEIIPTVIDLNRYNLNNSFSSLPPFRAGEGSEFYYSTYKEENTFDTSPIEIITGKSKAYFESEESETFILGWIGTKSTFEKHLAPCKDWMIKLLAENPEMKLHIIGIPEDQGWGSQVRWISWSEETEVLEIGKMDVGIMPLQDSLWEKGKCAYKLIQYGACGIPGVASDVGMNREVTIPNQTGFLANTPEEWINPIMELKYNPLKKKELGLNARKLVEEKYCLQVTAKKWVNLLSGN